MALVESYHGDLSATEKAHLVERLMQTGSSKKNNSTYNPTYMRDVMKCMSDGKDANEFEVASKTSKQANMQVHLNI